MNFSTISDITILHIDDHADLRDGISGYLSTVHACTNLIQAASGEEGVVIALCSKPDVILLDISMPCGIDGAETAKIIRASWPEARILHFTSGWSDTLSLSLEAGVAGYLYKSCTPNELVAAIQAVHAGENGIRPADETEWQLSTAKIQTQPELRRIDEQPAEVTHTYPLPVIDTAPTLSVKQKRGIFSLTWGQIIRALTGRSRQN